MARPALFLDRDGTIIVDVGYPRDPDRVQLLPGAAEALRSLAARAALVIVSNQSGLARGRFTRAEADAVHARVVELLAAAGVTLAGAHYCWHGPDDGCCCRKPAPGLLLAAADALDLDLAASMVVGDKPSDVEAGRAAGCAHGLLFAAADAPAEARAAAAVVGWPAAAARLHGLLDDLHAADDVE
jgi:histidinol-phosphate phosphatase family protein